MPSSTGRWNQGRGEQGRRRETGYGAWTRGLLAAAGGWALASAAVCAQEPAYNRDIRPILAANCFACHGQDAGHRQAGLRLDTAEGATADLGGSRAIVPGDPDSSQLWLRINETDPDLRMPPPESRKELTDAERETLRRWIETGARYEQHWSFTPVREVAVPPGAGHPIDAFLEQRLATEGLQPAPEADRAILIRRVAFVLTGLPPSLEEQELFFADREAGAYERMVDRYLDSPHYGEEMARHWLDLARYGDTHGLHLDNERQMWAWRDWVVRSFNRNQRFDEFTIWQLAGDLLPDPEQDQLIATGFNRCNVTTSEGGAIDDEFRFRYAVDRTSTMAQVWMGLTAGCAVCHDHKFDPLPQREFYSLYAFFNSAADPPMDGNALLTQPVLRLETADDRERIAAFDRQIRDLEASLRERVAAFDYSDPAAADPVPEPVRTENIWLEDEFPAGGVIRGSPGHPTQFVSVGDGGLVFSGDRAVRRIDPGLAQDVWDEASTPLVLPQEATIFAHVHLDPDNPPRAVMLQFFKRGWLHRAVWGDYEIIDWGRPGTSERVAMGDLPTAGEWVRLEVPASRVGLAAGDEVTGFALTQYGGTVHWDRVGVEGIVDPARDPARSFRAWWSSVAGKDVSGLPDDLRDAARGGPDSGADGEIRRRLELYYLATVCETTRPALAELNESIRNAEAEREKYIAAIPSTFVYRDLPEPRPSFVMLRGQYDQPGEPVEPGVPAALPPLGDLPAETRASRLDLARWLVRDDHPLTARVIVNRFWQQVFGTGLVRSSGDFGVQGELPSHPELLDWLARHFRESGWDVRGLIRLMVTSAAFRRAPAVTPELLERDPENRLLARGPRMRLDAEQLRDNVLCVSGLLDRTMGGAGVRPYQPANIWEPVGYIDSNTRNYRRDSGPALYRRSLYTFFKRTAPPPFMVNFDAPNREQVCTRRERSNTPLQALQLLNDEQHVEAARHLAQRLLLLPARDDAARLHSLYRMVLAREADEEEIALLLDQLRQHRERYAAAPDDADRLTRIGDSPRPETVDVPELAAWTLVTSTVFNLDETLCRN